MGVTLRLSLFVFRLKKLLTNIFLYGRIITEYNTGFPYHKDKNMDKLIEKKLIHRLSVDNVDKYGQFFHIVYNFM